MNLRMNRSRFISLVLFVCAISCLISTNALADATITGTVTDSGGSPIENLEVYAYVGQCWDTWVGGATTNASGVYSITIGTGDIPGSNEVYIFTDRWPSHQNYIEEWYDDTPINTDCGQAAAVAVTDGNTTSGIDFQLNAGPPKIRYFEVVTANGNLQSFFGVQTGYYDLVESAVVTGPGGFSDAYDIVNGKWAWLNECQYNLGFYDNYTGPLSDGEYTLTVTFTGGLQETATYNFSAAGTINLVEFASMSHTVNNDGSIDFNWTPPDTVNQYYQVRIYGVADNDRYYNSGNKQSENSVTANPESLRCLEKGQSYKWYVRTYNAARNGYENGTSITFVYNPSSLDHQVKTGVYDNKGRLELYFNTRPGSSNTSTVTSASVAGPSGFAYTFDLTNDWFDLSTPTRVLKGWDRVNANWPIAGGDYTFTIHFSDGSTVTQTKNVAPAAVTPVDDIEAEVYADGAIEFTWDLPDGVTNQYYQVRLRSLDGSKEYFQSSVMDDSVIYADFWDLFALEPGQTYKWFVRAWDDTFFTMRQSETRYFYYAPGQATGTVSGTVSITGASNGKFFMGAFPSELGWEWRDCTVVGVVESANGVYTLNLPAGDWYIVSVQDDDDSGDHDDGEPFGWYTGTTNPTDQFGLPVSVPLNFGQNVTGIDFTIYADGDLDGIPDVVEQGPDGTAANYDGNGDGTTDSNQVNVASFPSYDKQDYITLAVPSPLSLEDVMSIDNPSPGDAPADQDFTQGFFVFTIDGLTVGAATTVTLYLPAGEAPDTYYKYGPTPDNPVDHWYEFMYDDITKTGAVITDNVITLHFVDGKRGDDDLTANGTIEDIGGPAKTTDLPPPDDGGTGGTTGSSGGGGGGGCFITAIFDK